MRIARRLTVIGLLFCGMLILAANSWAQQRAPLLDQVARAHENLVALIAIEFRALKGVVRRSDGCIDLFARRARGMPDYRS